jgi:Zn-dependent M16 (insulinase) family peptidase
MFRSAVKWRASLGQRHASTYNQVKALRKYAIGSTAHGFEITRVLPVPEMSFTAVDLVHKRTGASHLHIDRDDPNSVFSIGFKTNPPDKTGVPHILEHTTLCGSYKYPVRDPFFKMLNRSLANFMNAMTGHDYTFFPFSTTNARDYENLRSVYLDSVFSPILKEEDFYQEGWRLENTLTEDKNSPLIFKGVVYNEMKGQLSNSSYLFWIKFQESIYPSLNNSGGDPSKMTNLTYEDLLDFHSENYHPSNAKTYTYGSLPLNDTLEHLNKEYVVFGKRGATNVVKEPIELKQSKTVTIKGPVDPMAQSDKQLKASITWKVGKPEDVYETFCLKLLSNLLTDGHSSSLYQSLIESGLGDDFTVNSGMESQTAANFFTVGLQGLRSLEELEKVVNDVLVKHSKVGFEDSKIEAIIQQLEIGKKDHKAEFGMNLLYGVLPGWVNKVDTFDVLAWDDIIEQFRSEYAKGQLFENLIKKHFLDQPTFKFIMEPSETYEQEVKNEETKRLNSLTEFLDDSDRDVIVERGLHLAKKQSEVEDLSSLPTLKVSDIDRTGVSRPVSFSDTIAGSQAVQRRITDTNGLTYMRAARTVDVPYELYPYLSLFSDCLTNLGTEQQGMAELEDLIKLKTGGLSSSISVHSSPVDLSSRISFNFGGVSLNKNVEHIYEIWSNLLLNTNFQNKEKLTTLIRLLSSNNISSLAESGHMHARNYAGAYISQTKSISESISGIDQLQFLNKLASWTEDETLFKENIINPLVQLKEILINSSNLRFSLISDEESIIANEKHIGSLLSKLPSSVNPPNGFETANFPTKTDKRSIIKLPFQVSYASSVYKGVPYTHEDGAKLQVLSSLLTYKHLHKEIREKGGAYGGGATYSGLDGLFSFYSYRDPNSLKSLETFGNSGKFALEHEWTETDLQEAKLTIFQGLDAPVSVRSEGVSLFKEGVTDEMRQTRREQLLDVDLFDVKDVAERYLVDKDSSATIVTDKVPEDGSEWGVVDLSVVQAE